jgi:hypothetical protein
MSRGRAIGTKGFCRAVVGDEKDLRVRYKLNHAELREARELVWESEATRLLAILNASKDATVTSRKSAPWKIAVATFLKDRCGATNDWMRDVSEWVRPSLSVVMLRSFEPEPAQRRLDCWNRLLQK